MVIAGTILNAHHRQWLLCLALGLALALPANAADAKKNDSKKKAAAKGKAAPKQDDPFADIIRKTDPLPPDQEQKAFHLPPGFEIQLVAAEPDIAKPMNMAFDAQGRLWVSESREYPFPAPQDKPGRDAVKMLSGFNSAGRARKITTFASGLNIPIGVYPYKNGALVYSIPYIYFLQDTDGDGKADKQELVLGRFGFEKDTHGMTSSFRRGYDGWIYADHGFNNDTFLTAKDGSTLKMNSGNCYRFRPDGSHVEIHSWGQVNPFGLMFDSLGDLWSADCHSMPVYLLLRGAYYPSFGKPNDGLGFGPAVMKHLHGSTAIGGIVYYTADNFPPEFQGNTFVGNVMTCKLNRDSYAWHGSTRIAKEEPDFLSCDDPWFRPVDTQLGPDGALYVADFYNRIIGHYELPLDHPGRDRERGRIWRIVYRGTNATPVAVTAPNLALPTSVDGLISELAAPNIARRMLAMNDLVDRIGKEAIAPLLKTLRDKQSVPTQKIHSLWALHRLGALDQGNLSAAAKNPERDVRVHTMRVLSEIPHWTATHRTLALAGLQDKDAFVQRAAADALGQHPAFENARPLLALRHQVAKDDTELLHVVRMALRNQFVPAGSLTSLRKGKLSPADDRAVADVAVAIPTAEAATFLLQHVQQFDEDRDTLTRYLRHASRYLPEFEVDAMTAFIRRKFADDVDLQLAFFKSIQDGIAQRGGALSPECRAWGGALADRLLTNPDDGWTSLSLPRTGSGPNPWTLQPRASSDGVTNIFLSSQPMGETLTGVLRSPPFTVPERLSFFFAGHDGPPGKPILKNNVVRLRDTATQQILMEASPPRNDVATNYEWNLTQYVGKKAALEIVDGDNARSYAWIAVGRFDPPVVALPRISPSGVAQHIRASAELTRALMLTRLEPRFIGLLEIESTDLDTRAAIAQALVVLKPDENLSALALLLGDQGVSLALREKIGRLFVQRDANAALAVLQEALRSTPYRVQLKLAQTLAGNAAGAERLLSLAEQGKAPARLLLDRAVKDKLEAARPANGASRIAKLTASLSQGNDEIQKLIDKRRVGFSNAKTSVADGQRIFVQTCTTCHRIDVTGGLVGPQLDGVGARGLERLIEDILDPNRNVDGAFHTHTIILKDGDVISGLPRREEGEVLVLAESTGKETSILKKDIKERRESNLSLMPDNFGEVIPEEDFYNLLAFLLSKGGGGGK